MEEDPEPVPHQSANIIDTSSANEKNNTSFAAQTPIATSPVTPVDGRRRSSAGNRDFRSLYHDLKIKTNEYTTKTEEQLAAQRVEISSLKENLKRLSKQQRFVRKHGDEQFLTKAKKKKCEFPNCTNDQEDALINCNVCGVWVCESCNDIPISKLKPLMNKCTGVFFACIACRDSTITNPESAGKVSELSTLVSTLQTKEKSLHEQLQSAINDKVKLNERIKGLEDEEEKTQNRLRMQGKLLQDSRKKLEEREADLKAQQTKFEEAGNPDFDNLAKLEQCMNNRLDKIENSIDQLITKKLSENLKEVNQIGAKIDEVITNNNKKTFAECVGGNVTDSLTAAFRANKNTEMVHSQEKEKRATNLIIYGIEEAADGHLEYDQNFVVSLLDTIGVAQRPKKVMRLGNKTDGKPRPVKLVMDSEDDKDSIMARLGNLKNADDIYRKVSIRDDYTLEERDMIREFVKKAEAKNLAENTQEWKVRGTPKTGLRLVRITKRQ